MIPRELRRLPEAEVIQHWAALYAAGAQPAYRAVGADQYMGLDAVWIEAEIPHDRYEADWNSGDLALSKITLALTYAMRPGPLPPGMASYKGREGSQQVCVIDGNHRAYAAFLRGDLGARFYLPAGDWEAFLAVIGRGREDADGDLDPVAA